MIPGIGVIGATAIEATVTDPAGFRSGRDLAAWIGVNSGHGAVPHAISFEILVKWEFAVHSREQRQISSKEAHTWHVQT